MSRDITQSTIDNLNEDVVYPFYAIELLYDGDQTLRLWTGYGTLVYQGVSWYGSGALLQVDSIEETTEISAKGASVTLSGIPSEVLSLALTEPYQGREAKIYFGTFSKGLLQQESEDYILLEDGSRISLESGTTNLSEIFVGYMDQMNIEETPDVCTIQLALENKLIDLERTRVARFTSAYQKSLYPNDLGLDFVESLQDKDIVWGRNSG
tara:strand:+ start:913 stop:1542 length:630 start_codon:yes stop_codon:yes gene_type:complete